MEKGIYSAVIAIAALVIAITMIGNTGHKVEMQEVSLYGASVVELKREWQVSHHIIDKATSEAINNSISAIPCGYNRAAVETEIATYYQKIGNMWGGDCTLTNITTDASNQNNITVDITLRCEKIFGDEFSAMYERDASFEKEASNTGCFVDVKDLHSGMCDIDGIISGEPDDIC